MKRIGNLYQKIFDIDNLLLADKRARRNKGAQRGIVKHDENRDINILELHESLKNKTFRTSQYYIFKLKDPKEREIYRLPYYPDRIVHHAIMNILEPIFIKTFTKDTYSCIKKRGIHGAFRAVKKALKDREGTEYYLKFDIRKFYPSINNEILKKLHRKKFKDPDLLWLLDEIIDSTKGCPIGNYLSQFFANFYMSYFDHWLKEVIGAPYYFRYTDDCVLMHSSKAWLWETFHRIRKYLREFLDLDIKPNYFVSPMICGLDFAGYKFYPDYTFVRKQIKENFKYMIKHNRNDLSIASYHGWLVHADTINLRRKYL